MPVSGRPSQHSVPFSATKLSHVFPGRQVLTVQELDLKKTANSILSQPHKLHQRNIQAPYSQKWPTTSIHLGKNSNQTQGGLCLGKLRLFLVENTHLCSCTNSTIKNPRYGANDLRAFSPQCQPPPQS